MVLWLSASFKRQEEDEGLIVEKIKALCFGNEVKAGRL